ncbi:cytochrome B561, N terminal-domain-containing protein [Linnemannia elongata]|nr:cytochrome B561, N terminal-domain-containing protein [Linnemannia elongata]
MAELPRPRPSKTNPIQSTNNNGSDEEQETFLRQPEPVQPGDRFFDRPALAFNPASVPLEENELGLFVKAGTPEVDEELVKDLEEHEENAHASSSRATRDHEDETMDAPIDVDTEGPVFSTPSSILITSSGSADKANQEQHTSTSRATSKASFKDLMNPTTTAARTSTRSIFEESVKPPTFNSTLFSSSEKNDFASRIAGQEDKGEVEVEKQEQDVESPDKDQEAAKPITLFPVSQPDRGLVLAVKEQGDDDQHVPDDEEDEEIPVNYPSLSDLSHSRTTRKAPQQSFETSTPAAVPTLPESTNIKRWDLEKDEELSDAEIDLDFINPRSKELQDSQDLLSPAAQAATELRVSPFAAFLDAAPLRSSVPYSGDELARSGRKGKQGMVSHSDDESDHDIKDYAGAAALAGGALLAKKILGDKDSGDEDSAGDVDLASLLREPLSKVLGRQFKPAGSERSSTSDDDMLFAGGVGGAVKSLLDMSSQKQGDVSDDNASEASIPTFTAAEKGKQPVRNTQVTPVALREPLDDLPPINSLADKTFGSVGMAPVLDMLSPTPVSPPAPSRHGPRSGIYPAPPPEPWGHGSLGNTLSQRRSPINNVKTDSADSKDAFNHDPNLAFAILPRKQPIAAQPKPAEGVRSLLSDYPDIVPKPAAASVPTVTLPADPTKAPVLRGRYELPSINKIDQWKSKNSLAPNAFRRLVFNVLALFVSNRVMKGRIYKSFIGLLSSVISPSIIYWTEWAVIIVLLFNVAEVIYSYTRRANNFETLPLTPSQRALLGLEPVASKVPGAVPIFKKPAVAPQNLTERPIMSTYVSPSQASLTSSRTAFQKPVVSSISSEYRDAATILNKSMSRAFNTISVQDKAGVERLMRNVEAREELKAEWKGVDSDPSKRAFGLHSAYGTPQAGLQGGIDMSHAGAHMTEHTTRPDLLASINSRGPVSRYQPALRTTLSKDHTSKTDLQKDGLYVFGHSKVLKSLKLSEEHLDRWVFNLRNWLWDRVVKHVCSEMEVVDAELAKQGLSYLDCKSATMFYTSGPLPQNATNGNAASAAAAAPAPTVAPMTNSLGWGAASIANPRMPSAFAPITSQPQQPLLPTSLQDLDARYGESPIVKQRMVLELYLAIPGFANRKYVVERLQAMGPLLSHFSWDSTGVTWEGGRKTWTADLPTDSQIIMHLFTVYMDLAMPAQPSQSYDRFPFSYKHYVPMEAKPDATTSLQIKQTAKYPPNYNLVVEGAMWEVIPKRLNVWYTLVLFIYMVMKDHGGYIGQINIGTRRIGLGDVVEGYDV